MGEDPSSQLVEHFSNELQVTSETPPTLLVHATDDKDVQVENSLLFYWSFKPHHEVILYNGG
ncbi:hypothetical protein MNBD_BACTEROID03-2665 [hydrothermal vent metagenome]|uniref:Uncharacterized protein n=1 Tax=hydrothermal vent metagenome TaxID=652676 RepID=A0A3B0TPU7_9ZZZZ